MPPRLKYLRKPNTPPPGQPPTGAMSLAGRRMRELLERPTDVGRIAAEHAQLVVDARVMAAAGADSPMPHNPTIAVHEAQLVVAVRVLTGGVSITRNFLGVLNPRTWALEDQREMRDLVQTPARYPHVRSYGYEDLRLFVRHGRLWASCTVADRTPNDDKAKIAVLELDTLGNVVACHVQPSDRHEKNWMPVVTDGELRFVYGIEPTSIVVRYDDARREVWPEASRLPSTAATIRGGSQLLPWRDGHLAVVHQVHTGPVYLHRFVFFDRLLQVQRIGRPWFFREQSIEFCAGMALHGTEVLLTYGARDREAWLARAPLEEIERLLA